MVWRILFWAVHNIPGIRALLGTNDIANSALFILRQISHSEAKKGSGKLPIEDQVFFLFANRIIIDGEAAIMLANSGYYGSGYAITAVMLRSITMYASLVSDKSRLTAFWNEDKDTYQIDENFYKTFREGAIRAVAQSKFGKDAFEKSEFEKLLHGSCFAVRKYYSNRQIDERGKSYPMLMFGKFRQPSKEMGIKSVVGAIVLDFLGIYFTEYEEKKRHEYDYLLHYYYTTAERALAENKRLEAELLKVSK